MKTRITIVQAILAAILIFALGFPQAAYADSLQSGADFSELGITGLTARVNAKLTINNKTGAVLPKIILNGPRSYTFYNIPVGQSQYDVEKGKYKIEYTACGKLKKKNATIQGNYKLTTANCPKANITVLNITGATAFLTLTGPARYDLVVPFGISRYTVLKGTYNVRESTMCGTYNYELSVRNRLRWILFCV